jgi:hypothetical protein
MLCIFVWWSLYNIRTELILNDNITSDGNITAEQDGMICYQRICQDAFYICHLWW